MSWLAILITAAVSVIATLLGMGVRNRRKNKTLADTAKNLAADQRKVIVENGKKLMKRKNEILTKKGEDFWNDISERVRHDPSIDIDNYIDQSILRSRGDRTPSDN